MMGPPPGESVEERAARWVAYVRREMTPLGTFRPGRRRVKVHHPDLARWLADVAEQALSVQDASCTDESHRTMEADLATIRRGLDMFYTTQYQYPDDRVRMAIALLNDIRRIVQ